MPKRSSKKQPNKVGGKGLFAAAAQDVELTVEQLEREAGDTISKIANLTGVKALAIKPIPEAPKSRKLPDEKPVKPAKKRPKK